jgi:hypothetical protein
MKKKIPIEEAIKSLSYILGEDWSKPAGDRATLRVFNKEKPTLYIENSSTLRPFAESIYSNGSTELEEEGVLTLIAHRYNTHQQLLYALKGLYNSLGEEISDESWDIARRAIEAASFVEVEE